MTGKILTKLYEHNLWANNKIIEACAALSDEQLEAQPHSATKGTIRRTLQHLVYSQQHYLGLLTLPLEVRLQATEENGDLQETAKRSGEGLLALAEDEAGRLPEGRIQTTDGYFTESWVVMLQAINHATEHREQIKSMLSSLGITPPDIDGWDYAEKTGALVPVSK